MSDHPSSESPLTPFGPAEQDLQPQETIPGSLDHLESLPAESKREELLREASRSLYCGLKSLMEAVVLEEQKGGKGKHSEEKVTSSMAEAMMHASAEAEARKEATAAEECEAEQAPAEPQGPSEDLDALDNHVVIQCWPDTEPENVPPVFMPDAPVQDTAEPELEAPTPISPFSQSPEVEGKTLPELGLHNPELTQSKITPMTPPLSLTDLQAPSAEAKKQPEQEQQGSVPPSPFHVVSDEPQAPSAHTTKLTPLSIPAGEGTPSGPNSVTDPLDGEQEIEVSKHLQSLKKAGNYPFSSTIPGSEQKKKAS